MLRKLLVVSTCYGLFLSCAHSKEEPKSPQASAPAQAKPPYGRLSRMDFNRRAVEMNLPFFWKSDVNQDGILDVNEWVLLLNGQDISKDTYVTSQGFTEAFSAAYEALLVPGIASGKWDKKETQRRETVLLELAQGRPTLVETDFSQGSEEDKQVLKHLLAAARLVERMYQRQKGVLGMDADIPADDAPSRALFRRNQGPFCVAPQTEKNADCSALPSRPQPLSGLYPASLQKDEKFCEALGKMKNGKALTDHFTVVTEKAGQPGVYEAKPYSVAYQEDAEQVAATLLAAAKALKSPSEASFRTYLLAASKAFLDNQWEKADAAWAAMGGKPSKWYLRIGPDEVYHEPCALKAGFHVSFARINQASLSWQQKLEPVKKDMENELAALAGKPYQARNVKFKLPDFIDVVLNAGDARAPLGATIGQSLPNWGKVAEKGGRTVVMTNLYTDADSQEALKSQMASLFCSSTFARVSTKPEPALMSTVLHEAAHNLGPSHDYKVNGQVDDQIFGGTLASMLEELKAQTSALYFSDWLVDRKLIAPEEAEAAHLRDVAWAFGHIAQGMYSGAGKPKPYSQLASVQLGTLWANQVLVWKAEEKAANGQDVGCFEVNLSQWKPTVHALARRVLSVKGSGDKAEAEKMKAEFVDAKDSWSQLRGIISERWLRAPKASFVYSVRW